MSGLAGTSHAADTATIGTRGRWVDDDDDDDADDADDAAAIAASLLPLLLLPLLLLLSLLLLLLSLVSPPTLLYFCVGRNDLINCWCSADEKS
jgi:hypothetical protein